MTIDRGYANPDVLVTTAWVASHGQDRGIQLIECDEDVLLYELGHIQGAFKLDWHTDLQHPLIRDFIDPEGFDQLMQRLGIERETTLIFYGDKNNWWATYAYWFFKYMGHQHLQVMDGGRAKWEAEGRPYTRQVPEVSPSNYSGAARHPELRAFRDEVLAHSGYRGLEQVGAGQPMVDVRSPGEFSGEVTHMPEYPQEGVLRGGHIPGAANIPWGQAVAEDGTIKPAEELRELYGGQGIVPEEEVITYCRIGERSSHTWFVLHELLGYPRVRNYDGSWTEWGNIMGVPIEK